MQTEPCTKTEKEKIRGRDLVSEPQKLEFCVDLLACQGVCLGFAPSFFGYTTTIILTYCNLWPHCKSFMMTCMFSKTIEHKGKKIFHVFLHPTSNH